MPDSAEFGDQTGCALAADRIWGTGTPRREFLYVDDFVDACVFVLKNYSDSQFINIGLGEDLIILEFAHTVAEVVGYPGIICDPSKLDGAPRKLVDVSQLTSMGWKAKVSLEEGLKKAYADFLMNPIGEK